MNAIKILEFLVPLEKNLEREGLLLDLMETRKMIVACKEEIAYKESSKGGNGNRYKAALRLAKRCVKELNYKPALAGAVNYERGQYICNGYCAAIFDTPFDGLPMAEKVDNPFDIEKAIPQSVHNLVEVSVPDVAELRTHLKVKKAERKKNKGGYYLEDIGENTYNLEYLIDVIEATEPERAYLVPLGKYSSIYFEGDGTRGIVLPLRRSR